MSDLIKTSIKIDEKLYEKVIELAKMLKTTRSDVIRMILEIFISEIYDIIWG